MVNSQVARASKDPIGERYRGKVEQTHSKSSPAKGSTFSVLSQAMVYLREIIATDRLWLTDSSMEIVGSGPSRCETVDLSSSGIRLRISRSTRPLLKYISTILVLFSNVHLCLACPFSQQFLTTLNSSHHAIHQSPSHPRLPLFYPRNTHKHPRA
jgi:hypothetical protein